MSTIVITPILHKQMLQCSKNYSKSLARLADNLAYHAGCNKDIVLGTIMLSMLIDEGHVFLDGDETAFIPRDETGEFRFNIFKLAYDAVEFNQLTGRNSVL